MQESFGSSQVILFLDIYSNLFLRTVLMKRIAGVLATYLPFSTVVVTWSGMAGDIRQGNMLNKCITLSKLRHFPPKVMLIVRTVAGNIRQEM